MPRHFTEMIPITLRLEEDIKNLGNTNLTLEGVSGGRYKYTLLSEYDPTHLTIFGDYQCLSVIADVKCDGARDHSI